MDICKCVGRFGKALQYASGNVCREDSVGLVLCSLSLLKQASLYKRFQMIIRKKEIQQRRLIIGCKDIIDGGKEEAEEQKNGRVSSER